MSEKKRRIVWLCWNKEECDEKKFYLTKREAELDGHSEAKKYELREL